MIYLLYFFIVLAFMPVAHFAFLWLGPKTARKTIYAVYFLMGLVAWGVFRLLVGGRQVEWWGALIAAFLAICVR